MISILIFHELIRVGMKLELKKDHECMHTSNALYELK